MTAPLQRPIRMGALGMDQRQRNTLRLLFQSKCFNRYILAEDGVADIYILDLDVYGGERLREEFRKRHPDSPLIILSLNPRVAVDLHTLFVQKPIVVPSLMEAIEQHRGSLAAPEESTLGDPPVTTAAPIREGGGGGVDVTARSSVKQPRPRINPTTHRAALLMSGTTEQTFVGTSPDIDPTDREQLAKIYYDPDLYLQGHFKKALDYAGRMKKGVILEGPWPTINILIDQDMVSVHARERHLRPYCTLPDATRQIRLRLTGEPTLQRDPVETYHCSTKAFLWQLALWASRGRLPEGTDIHRPIHLRHWPNFTRMTVTPHALAITALWTNEPHSLIDTARVLHIPQRYVFAFYSAANALQLIKATTAQTTYAAPQQSLKSSKYRGTLGRLLGYLKGQIANPTHLPGSRWH